MIYTAARNFSNSSPCSIYSSYNTKCQNKMQYNGVVSPERRQLEASHFTTFGWKKQVNQGSILEFSNCFHMAVLEQDTIQDLHSSLFAYLYQHYRPSEMNHKRWQCANSFWFRLYIEAYAHQHKITNETSNDKSAQRQTRHRFDHTATSACQNVDESWRCFQLTINHS